VILWREDRRADNRRATLVKFARAPPACLLQQPSAPRNSL